MSRSSVPIGILIFSVALIAVAIIIVLFVVPNFTNPKSQGGQGSASMQASDSSLGGAGSSEAPSALPTADYAALSAIIGDEAADALFQAATTNDDANWIISHVNSYEFEGPEVEYKILTLAANEPESYAYVREFPEKYPQEDQTLDDSLAMSTRSPSPDVRDTKVPHLYQWDRRWGQTMYCSTTFGLTACGPTTLAMVYQGLTGNSDLTPYDFGIKAQEHGYMQTYDGTDAGFFTQVASEVGLTCTELNPSGESIISELQNGHPLIVNLAPGYFTRYGHFFVLAGLTDDGQVIINDPYSVVRSGQMWDADFIAGESRVMYAYSL